jgi:hypothetical protein
MLQKNPSKNHLYKKKSKCSKHAHLWLNPLSLLAYLTMIAPKNQGLLNIHSLINLTSLHQDFKPLNIQNTQDHHHFELELA